MSTLVIITTLCAAFLHATWNALVKGGEDKVVSMSAMVLGSAPLALGAIILSPLPAPESWPYITIGIGIHIVYQYSLLVSYRLGDLTQVYPLARGSAPMIVAIVSVVFLGETLSNIELFCIFLIAAAIMSLSLARQHDGLRNPTAAAAALFTGLMIASYSLNDGTGARLAGTAVGFYAWLTFGNSIVFGLLVAIFKPCALSQMHAKAGKVLYFGSNASFVAYTLVVWAFTQAPIALVTALRETSIIFAILIGVFFLKERMNLHKVISSFFAIAGVVLLRFVR